MKIDLSLSAFVALFGLLGFLSGAMSQVRHWLGLILAAVLARPLGSRLTPYVAPHIGIPPACLNVALSAFLFGVVYVLVTAAAGGLLLKLFPGRQAGRADRALGFGLGAAKGAALVFVILSLLIFFEKPLTASLGEPPPDVKESRIVALVRSHDLFDAVPIPALAQIEKLIAAAKSPAGVQGLENQPELRKLLDDPQLKAALQSEDLSSALKMGDLSGLKNDPRLRALLNDPRLTSPTQP
ncbi:MAG: CvpA family protein [Elusimicrobiota bacterium]